MKTRDEFPDWLASRGYLRMAEIGVAAGSFARQILSRWAGAYTMIDAWAHLPHGYTDIANVPTAEHEQNLNKARAVAAEFAPRVQLLRLLSVEAAKCFPDEYFDVVYLDANHSYEAVFADLTAWARKVRQGGAIAGHDYLDGVRPEGVFGVKRAVSDFFGRDPDIVTSEKWPTWIMNVGDRSQRSRRPAHPRVNLRPISIEQINEQNADRHVKAATARAELCSPPDNLSGRGIVICGGGKYAASAWVTINLMRLHGCTLPIQLWYLGAAEVSTSLAQALAELDVETVNAYDVMEAFPHKRLNGWEVKAYSLLHCPWREVMLLDADNIPLRDVTDLFDNPFYLEHGSLFWPDRGRFTPENKIWSLSGVEYRDEPEFESGQMLVDRRRCWREVVLANWFNEESAFWYQHIHGDKDTFRLAWRSLGTKYSIIPFPGTAPWPLFYQKSPQGELIFHHGYKWQQPPSRNQRVSVNSPLFPHWEDCFEFMKQFEAVSTGGHPCRRRGNLSKRSKTVVLQFGSGNAADLLNITAPIHHAECDRYGYDLVVECDPKLERPYCWEKVRMVLEALDRGYEHIVWIDADALWLGTKPLLDCWTGAPDEAWFAATYHDAPGSGVYSGSGHHYDHFNTGVFFLRKQNEKARELCECWLEMSDDNHPWGEQHALHKILSQQTVPIHKLDHSWNSVQWLPQYSARDAHIVAWHGQGPLAYDGIRQHAEKYWGNGGETRVT